jgi:beta-glucosidase
MSLPLLAVLFLSSTTLAQTTQSDDDPPTTAPASDPAKPAMRSGPRRPMFLRRHQEFLQRADKGDIDFLFVGDTAMSGWESRGEKVWSARLAPRKSVSFSLNGDLVQNILWRLMRGELSGIRPKAIILQVGASNKTDSPADVARGVDACVSLIRKKCPNSKLILTALFPAGPKPDDAQRLRINAINEQLKKLTGGTNIIWLDLNNKLLRPDGTIDTDLLQDAQHPTEKGYAAWADALDPLLEPLTK